MGIKCKFYYAPAIIETQHLAHSVTRIGLGWARPVLWYHKCSLHYCNSPQTRIRGGNPRLWNIWRNLCYSPNDGFKNAPQSGFTIIQPKGILSVVKCDYSSCVNEYSIWCGRIELTCGWTLSIRKGLLMDDFNWLQLSNGCRCFRLIIKRTIRDPRRGRWTRRHPGLLL